MKNYKLKSLLATIIQFGGAIFLGWYFNHLIEIIITIPLFFYFRSKYTKTFHANTIWHCTAFTLIMFLIISLLSQPIAISICLTIILSFVNTEVLHHIKIYLDFLKVKKFQMYRGMPKDILRDKCEIFKLDEIETNVLIYFYCDKLKLWEIANILNYSEIRISQIKKDALNKFSEDSSEN